MDGGKTSAGICRFRLGSSGPGNSSLSEIPPRFPTGLFFALIAKAFRLGLRFLPNSLTRAA